MAAIGRRRDAFLLFEGPLPRKEDLVTLWRRTKRVRQKIKDMVFKDTLCFSLLCEKNIFIHLESSLQYHDHSHQAAYVCEKSATISESDEQDAGSV